MFNLSFNFFGKKAEAANPTSASATTIADPQTTIVKLRENIKNQEKREDHIGKKIDTMVKEAKEKMAKGDKKGALFAMKRKKLYEAEVEKIQNVKMTLETQVMNLESAAQNAQTFKAMEAGSKTMKKIRRDVGIEKVDGILDGMKEEMEMAAEINEALTQPVDPFMTDEDELLSELQELEQADLEGELLKPTPQRQEALSLPGIPDSKLPVLAKVEEDDLKKLEAELAGQ